MGTSTARRGPSTAAWRLAKGIATRYMSPEGSAPVEAREVVRRYVAALQETSVAQGQDFLAGFRLTRKVAQSLGEFGDAVAGSGLAAALEASGFKDLAQLRPEEAILGLTQAWVEEGATLEAAVARTAVATCLGRALTSDPIKISRVNGSSLVKSFVSLVLCQRLAFDLGESLEAAANGWLEYQGGLARLQDELMAATIKIPNDLPKAGQWQGLAGWLFVTKILENVLQRFQDARPPK